MKVTNAVFLFLCLLIGVFVSAPNHAAVDVTIHKTLNLEETPLDTAMSVGGKFIFILTDQRKVLVYTPDGKLRDTIPLDTSVDYIKAGPREDILLLVSSEKKTVQVALLDFVQEIHVNGSPFKGAADAPVTVVLFTDFQCPYCAQIVPLLNELIEKNKNKVKLVFKNFPLNSHRFAWKAAAAALAADKQAKFWEYHDRLFQNYSRLNDQLVQGQAQQLGFDMPKFKKDMNDPQIMRQIKQDMQDGGKAGVKGTPTIFVNGVLLRDINSKGFQSAIDKQLAKTKKRGTRD